MSSTGDGNSEKEWDQLKHTPATILVDGLSINDYLSLIRDQVNLLRDQVKQQNNVISDMKTELENEKLKNKEMNDKNEELLQRIIAIETGSDPKVIQSTLAKHEDEIKDLITRPIVDLGDSIRLAIVEKKLASFYGDDINILGRVAHLENLREMDKQNSDELHKSQQKALTTLDKNSNDLKELKQALDDTNKELTELKNKTIDETQLTPILHEQLKKLPTQSDLNTIKDLINLLANENSSNLQKLHSEELTPLVIQFQQIQHQFQEFLQKNHEPSVHCYGTDQSARISTLESRQHSLELLPQSLEDLRQRLLSLEDQTRQVMKSTLLEATERNKSLNLINKLDNIQIKHEKQLNETQQELTQLFNELQKYENNFNKKIENKISENELEKFFHENLERTLEKTKTEKSEVNENYELIKEFCKELEKRVFILANECRDGLEFVQNSQDKKIEILTKWILKYLHDHERGVDVGVGDGGGTDIGVKCLACNQPSSHVNGKTTVGGGYSFGSSERFGGGTGVGGGGGGVGTGGGGGHTSPTKPTAPYRVTVPESLRSLITKSREGVPRPPSHGDYNTSTQRLYEDRNENIAYEDLQPQSHSHSQTQRERDRERSNGGSGSGSGSGGGGGGGGGKGEVDRDHDHDERGSSQQPHWNSSRLYRGFTSRPLSANRKNRR